MRLGVYLLGPLEVQCAGRVVPIGAAKERMIAVLLALSAGRVVPIERLVDAAWAEDPPKSATTTVRVLVSRLRKSLAAGGCREAIETRRPGYLMVADSVDVSMQGSRRWPPGSRGAGHWIGARGSRDTTCGVRRVAWRSTGRG